MATQTTTYNLWGAMLARGIATVLFGIAAIFWPGITLVTLVYLFSALILVNGLIGLISGISNSGESSTNKALSIIVSIVEIGVGIYLVRHPQVTFATLILLIGFVLVVHGLFEIVGGLFTGHGATNKMLTVISGVISALAGLVVLMQPASAGVTFVWVLGVFALLSGPLLIAMSLDVKQLSEGRKKA